MPWQGPLHQQQLFLYQGKQTEQPKGGAKSTQDDKGTSAGPIVAGVISVVIVLILVAAFVIYRMRHAR